MIKDFVDLLNEVRFNLKMIDKTTLKTDDLKRVSHSLGVLEGVLFFMKDKND